MQHHRERGQVDRFGALFLGVCLGQQREHLGFSLGSGHAQRGISLAAHLVDARLLLGHLAFVFLFAQGGLGPELGAHGLVFEGELLLQGGIFERRLGAQRFLFTHQLLANGVGDIGCVVGLLEGDRRILDVCR